MEETAFRIPRHAATLRAQVEDRLRAAITEGRFKPGQRLVERELCELIGVGRTSIREAIRQLEAEGLVTNFPHRGPIVSTMNLDEARQLYAVRALLEGYAGREFATRGNASKIAELSIAVSKFEEAAAVADQRRLLEAKTLFYSALIEGSGNIFIKQILRPLHNRINLLRVTSMTQPGRLPKSIEEIREIRDAIISRDGDRAERACTRHIERAADAALAYLAKLETQDGE